MVGTVFFGMTSNEGKIQSNPDTFLRNTESLAFGNPQSVTSSIPKRKPPPALKVVFTGGGDFGGRRRRTEDERQ
jgi:hypothetical protein